MFKFIINHISRQSRIFYKVTPLIILVLATKTAFHHYGYEFITLNAIFSGLIGANVFLMGFLLSGVLADFKESEKIPGELSATIATIADEIDIMCRTKESPVPFEAFRYYIDLGESIRRWLYQKEKTGVIYAGITGLNDHFIRFEGLTQANFIARLKQEQNTLRKLITRIQTIRDTHFISSGYFIASTTTVLLLGGLIFLKIEPFYEALFFVGVVSYLLIFLIFLIRDLDNPFDYSEEGSSEDVSLKPLLDVLEDLHRRYEAASSQRG